MRVGDKVRRSQRFFDRFGVSFIKEEVGTVIAVQEASGTATVTWGKSTTERLQVDHLEADEDEL